MIVEVGDQEIEFPDDMPIEEIQRVLRQRFRPKAVQETFDPTEGMSGTDRFLAGVGKGMTDLARGTGQLVGLVDQESIKEAADRDAALMDTTGGMAGNLVGNLAMLLPTAFIPGANTLGGSAAIGAASGLLTPVAEDNVLLEKAKSAGIGAGFGVGSILAGRGLHAGVNAASGLLEPFRAKGQDAIVGRVLNRFALNSDDAARAAGSATSPVPGYQQTLAEATQDPGLATLQRAVMNTDAAAQIGAAERANAVALKDAIAGIAGDDTAMTAAVQARTAASNPLYTAAKQSKNLADPVRTVRLIDRMLEANPANKALTGPLKEIRETLFESYPLQQRGSDAWKALDDVINGPKRGLPGWAEAKKARTIMDRVRKGAIDADEALSQLKGVTPKGKAFQEAVDLARQYIKTPEFVVRQKPQHIMSALDNIDAMLGKADNAFVRRELLTVKKSLANQLQKAAPEYKAAEQTFAQLSRPINQMQIGGLLSNKLSPALDDFAQTGLLRSASFAESLRRPQQLVQQATGLKRGLLDKIMEPEQLDTINNVGTALANRVSAQNMARPVGTNTAQNLSAQNLMRQIAGPLGLPESFMDAKVWPTLLRPVSFAFQAQEPAINQVLANAITDPQLAARLMKAGVPKEKLGEVIQTLARYGGMPAALSTNTAQE